MFEDTGVENVNIEKWDSKKCLHNPLDGHDDLVTTMSDHRIIYLK